MTPPPAQPAGDFGSSGLLGRRVVEFVELLAVQRFNDVSGANQLLAEPMPFDLIDSLAFAGGEHGDLVMLAHVEPDSKGLVRDSWCFLLC